MKKILFIFLALLFAFMLVACDKEGESGTTNGNGTKAPVFDTTTAQKNTDPSSPTVPENPNNTTGGDTTVLDPAKPSREVAQKIELYMTLSKVEELLGAKGKEKINSGLTYPCYYSWTLSDGADLWIAFARPKQVDNPEQFDIDADIIVISASIGEEWNLCSADSVHTRGIDLIGKTYNEIIDLIKEPYKKTSDNGTLLCSWQMNVRLYDLVICFDENMIAKDCLYDVTHLSITGGQIKIGTELSDILIPANAQKENEYKYITLSDPEYDPETKLTLYKWSAWYYGGDILIWFDEEQKIVKFKSAWIIPNNAYKIALNMTYSDVIDTIGEAKYITEDGIYQWEIADRYKTLSVKFAENADGILVVSEVNQLK